MKQKVLILSLFTLLLLSTVIAQEQAPILDCTNIENGKERWGCYGKAAQNAEDCDILEEYERAGCYGELAIKTKDIALCEEVRMDIRICWADVFKEEHALAQDLTFCQAYEKERQRDVCYKTIAFETIDRTLCANIVNKHELRHCKDGVDYTLSYKAKTEGSDLCYGIEDRGIQRTCFFQAKMDFNMNSILQLLKLIISIGAIIVSLFVLFKYSLSSLKKGLSIGVIVSSLHILCTHPIVGPFVLFTLIFVYPYAHLSFPNQAIFSFGYFFSWLFIFGLAGFIHGKIKERGEGAARLFLILFIVLHILHTLVGYFWMVLPGFIP